MINETIANLLDSKVYRTMLLDIDSRILKVANYKGIKPEGFDDWEPLLVFPFQNRDWEKVNQSFSVPVKRKRLRSYTKTRTGTWRDLAVRKRKTEVAQHLTPFIEMEKTAGHNMPLLQAVLSMIIEIENGEREISLQNLEQLHSS